MVVTSELSKVNSYKCFSGKGELKQIDMQFVYGSEVKELEWVGMYMHYARNKTTRNHCHEFICISDVI